MGEDIKVRLYLLFCLHDFECDKVFSSRMGVVRGTVHLPGLHGYRWWVPIWAPAQLALLYLSTVVIMISPRGSVVATETRVLCAKDITCMGGLNYIFIAHIYGKARALWRTTTKKKPK